MRGRGCVLIANIGNLKTQGKSIAGGVLVVIVLTFFITEVASAFNVSGTLSTILAFLPTLVGLGLLLRAIDVF